MNRHNAGCCCPECFGLAEYMTKLTGKDYGLPAAQGPLTLRVVTAGPPVREDPCKGTLTCPCVVCDQERATRVQRGGQGSGARQPWEPVVRRAA